jgi:membrane protease subunit HflK
MVEEVFKDEEGTVILDRNFDNFLPLRNLDSSRTSTGGRE